MISPIRRIAGALLLAGGSLFGVYIVYRAVTAEDLNVVGPVLACLLDFYFLRAGYALLKQPSVGWFHLPASVNSAVQVSGHSGHERVVSLLRSLSVVCYFLWIAYAVAAGMAFDAPASERSLWPWLLVGLLLVQLVTLIVLPRRASLAVASGRIGRAYTLVLIPIALFALPLVLGAAFQVVVAHVAR
jgi:hypothetical protein